jgi:Asp-tRNA(Asn)/Glu-tRNA(Gln) amidotransferase A subunit family amidase
MCQLALGTQTIGSIIRPAAYCGVFGFKPSFNRIPTDGLILFSSSADHVGFFCQDFEGLTTTAAALCDKWRSDVVAQFSVERMPVLGVPDGPYLKQATPEGLAAFEQHLGRFENVGCRIKRMQMFENIDNINFCHRQLVAAEFAREQREWFPRHKPLYRPKTEELILTGQQISQEELANFQMGPERLRAHLTNMQHRHNIDLWVSPAAPGDAPEGLASTGDPVMNLPWTHAGVPVVVVPSGLSEKGLPLGLQLCGEFMGDEILLAWTRKILCG